MEKNTDKKDFGWFLIVACLAVGLAPFSPEPHLFGKIKWIAGGANGMTLRDWGDALMHGVPMIAFVVLMAMKLRR